MQAPLKPNPYAGGESHIIVGEKRLCIICYKNVQTKSENVQRIFAKFLKLLERFVGQWIKNTETNGCHVTENLQFLDCCENCVGTVSSFCDEFNQLKCLELKLEWRVDTLTKIMKLANRVPSRMQQLRDCFKDHFHTEKDMETSEQRYEHFNRFRQQMIKKCKRKLSNGQPRVSVKRLVGDPPTTSSLLLPTCNGNLNNDSSPPVLEKFWGSIYSFTAVALLASISFEYSECNDASTTLSEILLDSVIPTAVVPESAESEANFEDHASNFGDVNDADGTDGFDGVDMEVDDNCSEQNFVVTIPLSPRSDNVDDQNDDISQPPNFKVETSVNCDPHLPSEEKVIEDNSGDPITNEAMSSSYNLNYIAPEQANSETPNETFEMETHVIQAGMTKKEDNSDIESPQPTPSISRAPHPSWKRKPQVRKIIKRKVLLLRRKTSNVRRKQHQPAKSELQDTNVEGLVQQRQSADETNHVPTYPVINEDGANRDVEGETGGEENSINIEAASSQNIPDVNVESPPPRYSLRGKRKICYQTVEEEDEDEISSDHDDMFDQEDESDMDEVSSASSHSDCESKIKIETTGERTKPCQVCSKTFTRNHDLKRHMKRASCHLGRRKRTHLDPPLNQETDAKKKLKINLLSCPVANCKDKCITKEELESHKDLHGSFQCQACEVAKEYAPDLSIHETEHVTKITNGCSAQRKCYRCSSTFITKPRYVNHHLKEHLGILNASFRTCTICGAEGMERRFVANHYNSHHNTNGLDPTEIQRCDYGDQCSAYFLKKGQLIHHKLKYHFDGKCPECVRTFSDYRFLTRHIQTSHPESQYVQSYEFRCDLGNCRKTFANKYDLNHHKREYKNTIIHRSSAPATTDHECDQCGRRFENDDSLLMHKLHRHSNGKCQECGKTFNKTHNLARHMMVRHPSCFAKLGSYACTYEGCNKTFYIQSLLNEHSRKCSYNFTEGLQKHIKCPKCDKTFIGEFNLDRHLKNVHVDRSFICSECGKAFKTRKYLEIHMVYHLGPDGWKFQCSTCGRKFADGSKLDAHMRTHSKEKPFICQICGERYAHRHNWKNHMSTKHKDEVADMEGA